MTTTQTIFAEDLKNEDTIIIPATPQTKGKKMIVFGHPEIGDLTVNGFCINETGHITPFQFGRKVDLEVER